MKPEMYLDVDGLKTRYTRMGRGPETLLIHGASLGSSLESWEPIAEPLAAAGLTVIAYDQPGFGATDNPPDYSTRFRRRFILRFMAALGLGSAHLVGHSEAGGLVTTVARDSPGSARSVTVIDTGSLLPPLPQLQGRGHRGGDALLRSEPSPDDIRRMLEDDVANHALLTPERVRQRYRFSTGKNYAAMLERTKAKEAEAGGGDLRDRLSWEVLPALPVPLLLLYSPTSASDRAARIAVAKNRLPSLNLHVLPGCGHLLHWDAPGKVAGLISSFVAGAEAHAQTSPTA